LRASPRSGGSFREALTFQDVADRLAPASWLITRRYQSGFGAVDHPKMRQAQNIRAMPEAV